MIAMIAAVAENRVIGVRNSLPWHLPTDFKYFKTMTTGKAVVMGRRTFQSIVDKLGKPLPGRKNIVITRDDAFTYPGVQTLQDPQAVTELAEDVFIIGGSQIYELMIDVADTLYITEVHATFDGDAFFPVIDPHVWREVSRDARQADASNQYDFDFVVYERIG